MSLGFRRNAISNNKVVESTFTYKYSAQVEENKLNGHNCLLKGTGLNKCQRTVNIKQKLSNRQVRQVRHFTDIN